MLGFPPLPPYEGLHPIVVHFPIALLLTAWVPMFIGLLDRKRRTTWFLSALMLLVLGTALAFFAVITGEATQHIIGSKTQEIGQAIHEHEETAELARNLFIAITLLFAALLALRAKLTNPNQPKKKKPAVLIGGLIFMALYFFGVMTLANAGHQGGLLVHNLGIHAPMGSPPQSTPISTTDEHREHNDADD